MNILVTGGLGYKGVRLVPFLLEKGHDVCVIDLNWFRCSLSPHPRLKLIEADFAGVTRRQLEGIELVIHLASVANDPSGDLDPKLTWETNVLGLDLLCSAMASAQVPRLIFASSGSVYGVSTLERVTENAPLMPISDYNKTKMIGERVVESYADRINVQIVRPATVCGVSARQRLDVVVNLLVFQAVTTGRIRVLGGAQTRPNIHIEDMIRVYDFLIVNEELGGVFNAGFENLTVLEIAAMVAERTNTSIEVEESNDPRSYNLDSTRLLSSGFVPRKGVVNAIEELALKFNNPEFTASIFNYNVKTMQETLTFPR